jgi:hypothetical protein
MLSALHQVSPWYPHVVQLQVASIRFVGPELVPDVAHLYAWKRHQITAAELHVEYVNTMRYAVASD